MTDLPSLFAIRAFEAAARHKGFAPAARELGTTAASVSYHVRQLERQTGLILFRRYPHRVELTDAGALVAGEASKAFDSLRSCFARAAESEESCLSVTALPTFGTAWLTPRLGSFRYAYPQIRLEIDLSPDAQDLATGRFDLAVRNGHGVWPALEALPLFPSIFLPLCAHELLGQAAALEHGPQGLTLPFLGRQDWWSIWFRSLGHQSAIPAERFGIGLAEEHLDAAAAMAGHGITIGSPILFEREIEAGRLVPIGNTAATDGRSFWLVYPRLRRSSRKIALFRDWLCSEAEMARRKASVWAVAPNPDPDAAKWSGVAGHDPAPVL